MFNSALAFDPSDGTSKRLSVPIVQALASHRPDTISQRYIRSEKERPNTCPSNRLDIPIIDMGMFLGDSDLCRKKEMEKLEIASQQWGFFQAVNHRIPGSLMERMKETAREFFELPLEEKLKYEAQEHEGYGKASVFLDNQKLDWSDIMHLTTLPPESRKMNFWPTWPVDFRATVDEYVMSNGRYKSVEHRAVTNIDRDRISIAMFYDPGGDTEVGPAPELIDELNPCQYRRFNRAEYMRHYYGYRHNGKKAIEFAKI
ncbi:hypothetical protein KI387_008976, partial [Taxus chinensis]